MSEDYVFCNRWRALGERVWVDPTITLGHVGSWNFTGCVSETLIVEDMAAQKRRRHEPGQLLADRAIERAAHDGDGTTQFCMSACAADALIAEIMRERDSLTADLAHHRRSCAGRGNVIGDLIGGFAKVSVPKAPSSSYTDPKTA
ncbi:MAG: hypothetical protein U1E25_14550 [Methylocystis sp.]